MKLLATLVLALCTLIAPVAQAGDGDSVAAAQQAAMRWMALIDAGEYAHSWQQAAPTFQAAVAQQAWVKAVQTARAPLGAVKSRKLVSATFTEFLPGAPAGRYVVMQFSTAFEKRTNAVETVTPMRDGAGHWRVSGYFIR